MFKQFSEYQKELNAANKVHSFIQVGKGIAPGKNKQYWAALKEYWKATGQMKSQLNQIKKNNEKANYKRSITTHSI